MPGARVSIRSVRDVRPLLAILAGLVLVIGLAVLLQWRLIGDLAAQVATLHGRVGVPGGIEVPGESGSAHPVVRTTPSLSSTERMEIARLRAEVERLDKRTQELVKRAANQPVPAVPLNLVPAGAWRNAGQATPGAAAETMMWAADTGEVDALANAIVLDPAAREKAEAILARLTPEARAQYGTPEKLMALFLAQEDNVRAMQVLGESTAGNDALVNLRLQKDDGKTKEEGYQFRRINDGWRLVVTGKVVDKYGKKLTEPPKKGK